MHLLNLDAFSSKPFLSKFIVTLATILSLSGCASSNGPLQVTEHNKAPAIDFEMTGIPLIYFGYGSSVPITENLSLTAAHVAKLNYDRVIAYHPTCDIALVESDNRGKNFPKMGLVYQDQPVTTYGVNGSGAVVSGYGHYRMDLNFVNYRYFKDCPASVMDAPVQAGMSGGGTFNNRGDLVGIIAAMADKDSTRLVNGEALPYDRLSLFISINYVRGWLDNAVNQYYGGQNQRLTWRLEGGDDTEQLVKTTPSPLSVQE
ncbi:serine protease [Vibrio tarriae]|uniref:serine protease n=1 Tax=Vibrio tarriae TaxID=2014742 RepID=UPI000DE35373|nr:serine protease [Vibrio tarriae]RBM34208.1 serine protease [Vibrio tarriae]